MRIRGVGNTGPSTVSFAVICFRAQASGRGLGVWGSGSRVPGSGFWVLGSGFRVPGFGSRVPCDRVTGVVEAHAHVGQQNAHRGGHGHREDLVREQHRLRAVRPPDLRRAQGCFRVRVQSQGSGAGYGCRVKGVGCTV